MAQRKQPMRNFAARNRKARFNYFIENTLEAGLVLIGTEIKSLRCGNSSIDESYATENKGEIYLLNSYIPEYEEAGQLNQHEVRRPRKILLHKSEIKRLGNAINREGFTLVPLSIYFNSKGIAKVELGLAKGKRKFEKRAVMKEREWERDKGRLLREKG